MGNGAVGGAKAAGNVACLLQTDFGVSTDRETVLVAMQSILQAPELGRGFADLARPSHPSRDRGLRRQRVCRVRSVSGSRHR